MKKVLGINGSPRQRGNTALLLESFFKGVHSFQGWTTEEIFVSKLNIAPCNECNSCYTKGECFIQDDMQVVYSKLLQTQHLVIATPVFFMGPPAPLKALIDRCQIFWAKKYILKYPFIKKYRRNGFLISVAALSAEKVKFQGIIDIVKSFFYTLGFEYKGELLFAGLGEKGAVLEHPDFLQNAFKAGQKICIK